MRFSLRLNNDVPPALLTEVARLAESHGFDQLWVSNDLFLRSSPVLLGALAVQTSRIHLGVGVFNATSVHTSEIAMMAATLQELSDGRFLLGLGAGAEEFLGWARLSRERPLATTRQAIRELSALGAGGAAPGWDAAGHLRFSAPPAPVYVGAMGPKMLALAGELADGALPLLYPPEHFATAAAQVHEGARAAGRDPATLDVAACIWCSISDDESAARRELAAKIAYYGASFSPYLLERAGLRLADFEPIQRLVNAGRHEDATDLVTDRMLALGIAGTADDVLDRCRGLVRDGASHVSFGPPLGPDVLAGIDLLGTRVLPALRQEAAGDQPEDRP